MTPSQLRIIEEIRRVAAELNVDRLSQDQFDKHHRLGGVTTAGHQFGSWNDAVKAAGLVPYEPSQGNVSLKLSDEELLRDLLRLESKLGGPPSERKLARYGQFSLKPYKTRWGSLPNAVKRAHELYDG